MGGMCQGCCVGPLLFHVSLAIRRYGHSTPKFSDLRRRAELAKRGEKKKKKNHKERKLLKTPLPSLLFVCCSSFFTVYTALPAVCLWCFCNNSTVRCCFSVLPPVITNTHPAVRFGVPLVRASPDLGCVDVAVGVVVVVVLVVLVAVVCGVLRVNSVGNANW